MTWDHGLRLWLMCGGLEPSVPLVLLLVGEKPSAVRALTSSVLPVLVGSDTPGPSLRTMLSGPQDWSFGGEAKTSCVRSATPRRQSAKPQWDVGRAAVNFYMKVLIRAPGDESVRQ